MSDGPTTTPSSPSGASKPPSVTAPESESGSGTPTTAAGIVVGPQPLRWRELWQVPTLLLALGLVGGGVFYILNLPRDNDFGGAFDQVDELLADGQVDAAKAILYDTIAPKLDVASPLEQARFEATTADWLAVARSGVGSAAAENDAQIVERYQKADHEGFEMGRERLLRWAAALVRIGRTEEAMEKVSRVDAEGDELDALRGRVRRMVMERAWDQATKDEHPDWEAILTGLGPFRADPATTLSDEAWAAARQAEARLALDRPREAADRLLLDLRRVESAPEVNRGEVSAETYAELTSLLGRAYAAIGEPEIARETLERALAMSDSKSIAKGEAILLLGQLALQRGDLDDAEQRFATVLAEYQGEACATPAKLGRAETRAARWEHAEALEDYNAVREAINTKATRRVTAQEVIGSLADRHDALLVAGELERALDYARMAVDFTPGAPASSDLIQRIATTSRALADHLTQGQDANDPEYRARAARLLRTAGEYFLRHAAHAETVVESPDEWVESTWMAADCYERAGWSEDALRIFRQFIESRPPGDLRRSEAFFRVASLLHAEGQLGEAGAEYARLIEEFPESPLAARATVPLARCLEATGRRSDAIARLQQTLDGRTGLKPDAPEYRDAMLELARLVIAEGDLPASASLLDEALRRYPDDPSVPETRFQLGECRRGMAREAGRQLADGSLSPSQRASIDAQRVADLESARGEFEKVVAALDPRTTGNGAGRDESKLDSLERDALRLAHLYRADCLFDLGRYQEAIDLYEIAERRYSDSAVSMVALIQIVNAWHELGDLDRAATAHRRAEIRLTQLPDNAFLEAGSIFSRDAWERWLRNAPPGARLAGSPPSADASERETSE
ncbi:MAG: tetratricopeptide repeat protein [Phycisphaerae bacterium]|jgi:tetratricopeptide (TPR) repeat protein|nr:tetratricopeptide repeat protein [Phycisphaerae bacterium]